jgi:membrane associated rhomboid family serine protease
MLPLKDDVPARAVPAVTVALIALNGLVFLYELFLHGGGSGASAARAFVEEFGLIPCRLAGVCPAEPEAPSALLTVFTATFLHGALFHVLGNMLYLWIFGRSVEGALGHGRFAAVYFACGAAAAFAQTMAGPASDIPVIGASGAVSGVLGAYLVLFPHARVLTLVVLGFFVRLIYVPALAVLGFWVVVQLVGAYVGHVMGAGQEPEASVGWFAHTGGLLAGVALLLALRPRRAVRL